MLDKIFLIMLIIGIPVSIAGSLFDWSDVLMFIIYCLTIVAIAAYIGKATENLSIIAGPRIGGLLNATFGNAVELIIAIFSLQAGLIEIVLASMTGSIIGNLLLVGGLSFFVGGLKYKRQTFNVYDVRHNSGMLVFAVIIGFVFPKMFALERPGGDTLTLSIFIAIILILLYLASLLFKLVTHRGVYKAQHDGEDRDSEDNANNQQQKAAGKQEPEWGLWVSMGVLAGLTVIVAYISESLVGTFEIVGDTFGWSDVFIGVIIVAIVGNAAEHGSAVMMAYKNRMGTAHEIAVGSTLQVAMFVMPLLVLISLLFSTSMPLVFTIPEMVSMVLAVLLTIIVMNDADTNWFEGATLVAAYLIIGIGFYLL